MSFFTMQVTDTFHLSNGTTIFLGHVTTTADPIRPCDCEIVVGNDVKTQLRIDGEVIGKPLDKDAPRRAERSVSTTQKIDWDLLGLGRSGFVIRTVD